MTPPIPSAGFQAFTPVKYPKKGRAIAPPFQILFLKVRNC
jgi:hypothetical protein